MIKQILHYFSLESEVENFDRIHEVIEKDVIFKGTNLWILMFAIIVASVGLNINSTAVIIGAMLISPLMGPINGMGYSIATYNFPLLKKAFKNFSFAVIASLVASTFYFAVSPVSTAHSELLARTSPTIYDVLIALFGGLAGIVAISSRNKGNVIPGVAIATALMPPLCTAGYGLATGQIKYFFGAFYLFTINTVFIALSAIVISQILKFPIRTVIEEGRKKVVNSWISLIIIITIIPSIYFGYILVQKEKFTENSIKFAKNVSIFEDNYLMHSEIDAGRRILSLTFVGKTLTEKQRMLLFDKARLFSLDSTNLNIQQGFAFLEDASSVVNESDNLKREINRLTLLLSEKEKQQDSIHNNLFLGRQLLSEIQAFYPDLASCAYSDIFVFNEKADNPEKISLIMFTSKKKSIKESQKTEIKSWLGKRLNSDSLRVIIDGP